MGKVLYGVMGDGRGHLTRSLAIARQLREHEILFVGGRNVPQEVARQGYTSISVPVMHTPLSGQRVLIGQTLIAALSAIARRSRVVVRLADVIEDFDPDLIVTDYEPILPLAARQTGRTCVSLDRQHALTHCHVSHPQGHRMSRILTVATIRYLYSAASQYLVCSFAPLRPVDPTLTQVVPPILREEVLKTTATPGDHAVVYVRGARRDALVELLAKRRRPYIVYGFGGNHTRGNITFRPISSEAFLQDLASCAYVISSGGHNLISEALYLRKPVFCMPPALFYEQVVNAHQVAEAGHGDYCNPRSRPDLALDAFEARLERFEKAVADYSPFGGKTAVSRLEELMAQNGQD